MPEGAVGHGGHYHSQSPEAYFAHTPGLEAGPLPLGPLRAAGKGKALSVRREQRIFSLSSATADGAPWPERAHPAAALAAALAAK